MVGLILVSFAIMMLIAYWIWRTWKCRKQPIVQKSSQLDNTSYAVIDSDQAHRSVQIMDELRRRIRLLRDHLCKYAYDPYIRQFCLKEPHLQWIENPCRCTSSYMLNKGQAIYLCLKSRRVPYDYHDVNTLLYVVLHEVAHMMCPEYGHTTLFYQIFDFLLAEAQRIGIYQYVDYEKHPVEYCGTLIGRSDSVFHKLTSWIN